MSEIRTCRQLLKEFVPLTLLTIICSRRHAHTLAMLSKFPRFYVIILLRN